MANIRSVEDREEAFCQHYITTNGNNATASALAAGYGPKGAKVRACELLKRDHVVRRIEFLRAQMQVRRRRTREDILDEYEKLAFSDIRDVGDKTLEELENGVSAAIAELTTSETIAEAPGGKVTVSRARKVKLYDKKGALDSLAKMQGFLVDRHAIGGDPDGAPLEIKHIMEVVDVPAPASIAAARSKI